MKTFYSLLFFVVFLIPINVNAQVTQNFESYSCDAANLSCWFLNNADLSTNNAITNCSAITDVLPSGTNGQIISDEIIFSGGPGMITDFLFSYKVIAGTDVNINVSVISSTGSNVVTSFNVANLSAGDSFTDYNQGLGINGTYNIVFTITGDGAQVAIDDISLRNFVTAGNCLALPVELISFKANWISETGIEITWETATELNNDHFELERSFTDSNGFEKIAFINGNGTTTEKSKYSFSDEINSTKIFYRLKQVDFDGTETYSNIISLNGTNQPFNFRVAQANKNSLQIFSDDFSKSELIAVRLVNRNGSIEKYVEFQKNYSGIISMDTSDVLSGLYILHIETDQGVKTQKVIF